MSGAAEDEAVEVEPEGQPDRLGLGARVPHRSKVRPSNDPVKRKLYAKLAAKRKASKSQKPTTPSGRDIVDEEDDDDNDKDLDSRSSAFSRKRTS